MGAVVRVFPGFEEWHLAVYMEAFSLDQTANLDNYDWRAAYDKGFTVI